MSRGGRRGGRAAGGRADGEVVACGLDHQGESVLAWDAESGEPLTPVVTWQDKRSQEVLDRLESDGPRGERARAQRLPLDPYFSAGKLTWLLEHDDAVARARRAGHAAARHRRLVALRQARRGLRHRSLDRVAHPALRAGRPRLGQRAARGLRRARARRCREIRDSAGDLGVLRHPDWPRELPLRARVRRPAGGARRGGLRRARARQGHLRHRACSCSRTSATEPPEPPVGGLLPTVAWRVDGRGGVRARRRRVHRRRAARVAEPRPRPGGGPAGARRARGRGARTPAACACCRRWRAWVRRGGGRTRARCSPG